MSSLFDNIASIVSPRSSARDTGTVNVTEAEQAQPGAALGMFKGLAKA